MYDLLHFVDLFVSGRGTLMNIQSADVVSVRQEDAMETWTKAKGTVGK